MLSVAIALAFTVFYDETLDYFIYFLIKENPFSLYFFNSIEIFPFY